MTGSANLRAAAERARAQLARGGRRIIGIAGAPGSGKSSLAAAVAAELGDQATVIPMDGFHLANRVLEALGRSGRKGAPDTFDIAGFIVLLRRLRERDDATIYAPLFRREIEEPIAGAIGVGPEIRLIVVEGNYLLCDGAWSPVRDLLDERWFVETPPATRLAWLEARHRQFGRSAADAQAWIAQTDEPNAGLIAPGVQYADWIFHNAPAEGTAE